jgi:hypothetical protein
MEITQAIVRQALNDEDIEGLLELGAPEDEYLHEAERIMTQIGREEVNEDSLAALVRAVWTKSFGPFTEEEEEKLSPAFRQVAQRILNNA